MSERKKLIGLCCTAVQKEPVLPLVNRLAELIQESGQYNLMVFHSFFDFYYKTKLETGARSVYELINYDMLDAMIIIPDCFNDAQLVSQIVQNCKAHNLPVISIDRIIADTFSVYFGYGKAFGNIVEHIITEHGCKKIKMVAGIRGNDFSQTRIDSCAAVMAEHGLTLEPKDIMYGEFWDAPTYAAMEEFFASGEALPDAFVCANDTMAMAVCLKLNERGIKVPDDVIVTGFDGIEIEKYHSPRLCTAIRDNHELCEAVMSIADKVCADRNTKPYNIELLYKPVFSESCGCLLHSQREINQKLTESVREYSSSRKFEEHMDNMENQIAASPTPENLRAVLNKFSFLDALVCVTKRFRDCFSTDKTADDYTDGLISYPQEMTVMASTYIQDGIEDTEFSSEKIIPDNLKNAFGDFSTLFIMPLHFQDMVTGYLATPHCSLEHHYDRVYSFTMTLNRCLETMRLYEHMRQLNNRLSFLFTHDQLTRIYNRYGFYERFCSAAEKASGECGVFIVSADLNDMKYINDNFGHAAGDEALIITANALVGAANGDDEIICSRFGGDEFVVAKLCCDDPEEQGERYHKEFVRVLKELNDSSGKPFRVSVSFGVYSASADKVNSVDSMIELADRLMYSDKAKHKRKPRSTSAP